MKGLWAKIKNRGSGSLERGVMADIDKDREFKVELVPYQVKYLCSYCDGYMVARWVDASEVKLKFTHICDKCKREEILPDEYPQIIHEEKP